MSKSNATSPHSTDPRADLSVNKALVDRVPESSRPPLCYEIQYTWTARSTETETETGLDRYVMLGARWLTEY